MSSPAGNTVPQDEQAHTESFTAEEEVTTRYVHPDSKALFEAAPCFRHIPIVGSAVEAFGPKCVTALGLVYVLSKGVGKNLLSYSMYPMFNKKFKVTPEVYQRMSGISSMGFSIKPLTAIFSDTFSFFGYTKRWYIAASCVFGAACTAVYGVLPGNPSSASIAAGMIFIATFCIANVDVLSEGHYSRLIKRSPGPGANLISWIWALIMVGSIIGSAVQGPLSDSGNPEIGIFISTGLQALCVLFFIFNWYGEQKNLKERTDDYFFHLEHAPEDDALLSVKNEPTAFVETPEKDGSHENIVHAVDGDMALVGISADSPTVTNDAEELLALPTCCCGVWEVNTEVIQRNTVVAAYGLMMTGAVVALTVLTIIGTTYQLLYGCVAISLVLCVVGFLCIPTTIMKANLFGWIQLTSYILIPGALDNFYMASSACLPEGPHFTQTFYNTIGAVIGNCAGLVGVYLFATVFSKRSYRLTCICTTIIQVVASLFDLIILKRWNTAIGIPDHAMYILGDAIVYQVCYMLNYMPMNMLISRLCPKGCESTMFAILASFSNLGASTSSTIGAILMETVWPVTVTDTFCDFSNATWLVIVGHLICPLICIPLVFLLLPGTRICDDIDPKLVEALPPLQKIINRHCGTKKAVKVTKAAAAEVDNGSHQSSEPFA